MKKKKVNWKYQASSLWRGLTNWAIWHFFLEGKAVENHWWITFFCLQCYGSSWLKFYDELFLLKKIRNYMVWKKTWGSCRAFLQVCCSWKTIWDLPVLIWDARQVSDHIEITHLGKAVSVKWLPRSFSWQHLEWCCETIDAHGAAWKIYLN